MSRTLEEVTCALDHLSADELRDVIAAAQSRLAQRQSEALLEERVGEQRHCPECGSLSFQRCGHTRAGARRWRCGDCRRTFTSATGTFLERVRKRDAMLAVAEDMMPPRPRPCRVLAEELGVHRMTVWNWRMRLMDTVGEVGQRHLAGIVEADGQVLGGREAARRSFASRARGRANGSVTSEIPPGIRSRRG